MLRDEITQEIDRDPFVPLRLHFRNGKKIEVRYRNVAYTVRHGVLIFKGKKEGSCMASGYDVFPFDEIVRIEKLPPRTKGHRRRKAS